MALPDFTGQNIQDTYQRVVQKGADGQLFDGTGSAVPIKIEGNNVRISGSLIAQEYVVSSSVANIITQQLSGSTVFGNSSDDTNTFTGNITSSGNISSSGEIHANKYLLDGNDFAQIATIGGIANSITLGDGTTPNNLALQGSSISALANITASGNISSSATLIANKANITGDITASSNISANRFVGDGRELFNLPQNLAWDGVINDGFLQIITNASFDAAPGTSRSETILTSSLEYSSNGGLFDGITDPVIYVKDNGGSEHLINMNLISGQGTIVFSGSNFAMDATLKSVGESSGLLHIIDMNKLNPTSGGTITDVRLLGAIRDKLIELQGNSAFNATQFNYQLQDSYQNLYLALPSSPQQIAISSLYVSSPENTKVLSFHYFLSASAARGGNTGVGTPDVFVISTNPNKVYSSLRTDLDTVFRSASVTIEGPTSNLEVGGDGLTVNGNTVTGNITSSANISASGTIIGSNLSGTNTGDQDLSNLVTNLQTASFAVTGSDVIFGHITASGNISASGEFIGAHPILIGDTLIDGGDLTIGQAGSISSGGGSVKLRFNAPGTGYEDIILFDHGNTNKWIMGTQAGTNDFMIAKEATTLTGTDPVLSIAGTGDITASGNISASGTIIANGVNVDSAVTFAGNKRILYNTNDQNLVVQDSSFKVNSHITASGNISASGDIMAGGTIQAGWHGSTTRIKILVSDFIPDDIGRPAMIDDTSSDRFLESFSTGKLFASIPIPTGFKATHVRIYGSGTSALTVYEADINSKTVTSKGTGNIGTELSITNVTSDTTNYLLLELAQASGEEVYGGYITIEAV